MSGKLVLRKLQFNTKVICPVMWTYNICAADTGTCYDYYWQNYDIFQWCINKTWPSVTGNKYSVLLCHKEVNDGLGIKSVAGLKTFVH